MNIHWETPLSRRVAAIGTLLALTALSVGCGDDTGPGSSAAATTATTPDTAAATTTTAALAATTPNTAAATTTTAAPTTTTTAAVAAATTAAPTSPTTAAEDLEIAQEALIPVSVLGPDWQDFGPDFAWPISDELVARATTCEPFVESLTERNNAAVAGTAFARNLEFVFATVIVFPDEQAATAVLDQFATAEFDDCWAELNQLALVALPFGITEASIQRADPDPIELGGDQSVLKSNTGTYTFGGSEVPDTCVCAFVRVGRAILEFHSGAPVFSAASRRDVIANAVERMTEAVNAV